AGNGWTTRGGTLLVLPVSTWSVIISGSRSTSLEEEEEGETECQAKHHLLSCKLEIHQIVVQLVVDGLGLVLVLIELVLHIWLIETGWYEHSSGVFCIKVPPDAALMVSR
nr:hypothetical protein [Tanacetum cinerariifolium]